MSVFNDFLKILKTDLTEIAKNFGGDIKNELVGDGQAFAQKCREDLERWTALLAEGSLTKEDFAYLVEAKKDLAEMEALKQKGLTEAKIDKLKAAVLNSVVGSALKVLRLR